MTRAFVVRIPVGADLSNGELVGRIEEVDTGREYRFTSAEELVGFLRSCAGNEADVAITPIGIRGEHDV